MPSSPLAPPASPPARDLVEFMGMGGSRKLEWACAAARLAGKEGRRRPRAHEGEVEHGCEGDRDRTREREGERERSRHRSRDKDGDGEGELTEEDDVEAVTPEGSLGASDAARWQGHGSQRPRPRLAFTSCPAGAEGELHSYEERPSKEVQQDEDMMRAALALCGLGRRSG